MSSNISILFYLWVKVSELLRVAGLSGGLLIGEEAALLLVIS